MDDTIYKRSAQAKDLMQQNAKTIGLRFKGQTVSVTKTISIGRESSNDVVLDSDPMVSRRHALIERLENACTIMDLGSTNGTYVNGDPLKAREVRTLKGGDAVRIGNIELQFLG
jgi:pSer/pThr/pTyr-binding forkhead associated (FHA) protein